jgi:hypothetical protein
MKEELHTEDLVEDADAPVGRDDSSGRRRSANATIEPLEALFDKPRAKELRDRWQALQGRFVDEPRDTVAAADALVAELLQELARGFGEARSSLERRWSSGDDVSTEELRVTLQRYRSFFERLLSV